MPTQRTLRAAIYARQSHGSERSLGEQIADCTADAEQQGWEIVGSYEDRTSASRHARKERLNHTRLLADLEAGKLDVVMVWESSRADRTLTTWSQLLDWCRDNGVLIRVTDDAETYDVRKPKHWKGLATDGINNAYASEETRQRNLRTARHAASQGKPNGMVPFGYARTYGKDGVESQYIVEEEATAVREVFTRVAEGEALKTLARELAARGCPAPGRGWETSYVRNIVKNPAYIGRRRHNGSPDTTKGIWPPIVDEQTYHAANRVLADRAARYWRPSRQRHLLTGIPVCEKCGGVYAGSQERSTGRRRYGCRAGGCGFLPADELDVMVVASVLERLSRKDVFSQLRAVGDDADAQVAVARTEVEGLRARLDDWIDSAVRGETSPSTMAKVERELAQQITAAKQKEERAGLPPALRDLLDADDLDRAWIALPMQAKRDVIDAVVTVTVGTGRPRVRLPLEDRVTVKSRHKAATS